MVGRGGKRATGVSQIQILLTERCNLTCRHCAVPAEQSPADHELSTESWKSIINVAAASGIESVVVNGGEALMRRDAVELMEHALSSGISWATLISNGMLFTEPVSERIADAQRRFPAFGVHISIDGATAATHDWMRGEGTFDRMMASIDRLRGAGGTISGVNSVLHAGNVDEFRSIGDLVKSLGAEIWTVFPNADLGRGVNLGSSRLSEPIWKDLYQQARDVRDRHGIFVGIGGPVMGDEWPEDAMRVPNPRFARPDKACLGPDGEVFTCPPLRHLDRGRVHHAIDVDEFDRMMVGAAETLDEACVSCKYLLVCTGVDLDDAFRDRPGPFGPPSAGRVWQPVSIRGRL